MERGCRRFSFLPPKTSLMTLAPLRHQNVTMDYYPPPSSDPLDGRNPLIRARYKTLRATKTPEDTDAINSDMTPYEDLQPSQGYKSGEFNRHADNGVLGISAGCGLPPAVYLTFRETDTNELLIGWRSVK